MSRVCEICGKSKKSGNKVTFSHRAIKRSWTPNLRRVRVYDENGTPQRKYVCTRCLRSGLVDRNRPVNNVFTQEVEETQETAVEQNEAVENVEVTEATEETVEENTTEETTEEVVDAE